VTKKNKKFLQNVCRNQKSVDNYFISLWKTETFAINQNNKMKVVLRFELDFTIKISLVFYWYTIIYVVRNTQKAFKLDFNVIYLQNRSKNTEIFFYFNRKRSIAYLTSDNNV